MTPPATTPLYNHPLPDIEDWLRTQGCQQDRDELNHWWVDRQTWRAEIWLDIDQLVVCYRKPDDEEDIQRSFKYSLSRQDVENAVFGGP
ncbi:DUF3143 domain-containing protein [Geitlerinema sp. CS-897]|uniref:DUF3143 domain-containing protein n=1 Tax=Baaleninema simplex TaxID=2862350 RepID=UPI00034D19A5|nr:DUF3143 domain-containing protein [Baaleninema simplex]MDC0832614.1 DUF3143 domain-containing protein [Geitlerinema sp. CS-897]